MTNRKDLPSCHNCKQFPICRICDALRAIPFKLIDADETNSYDKSVDCLVYRAVAGQCVNYLKERV